MHFLKEQLKISMERFELEKCYGTRDFALWRESLKGILVHQKVFKVLGNEKLLPEKKLEEKAQMDEMAYYTIIMYLSNSARRKLVVEKDGMISSLSLDDTLNKFNKIIIGLTNTNHKVDEDSEAIILLRSLPIAYQEVKFAIKYGRDVIALEDVLTTLKSKDFELQLEKES
uniref:Retrovirus-related Pol polyprotein from transposon TNT 1-94 n=1 Tax=Cannabis sativa TaxID=3483 RepID=A0A803PT19_CANSA